MTLTIDITPELESRLRMEAAKLGLNAKDFVVNTLQECLRQSQGDDSSHLTETETSLLQQINQGLTEETWQRYNELIDKRRAEKLTPEEQAQLIEISDRIEEINARRIEYLLDLASLRQISLSDLMQQMGIETPAYV